MPLSLAGRYLPICPPELTAWVAEHFPLETLWPFACPTWPPSWGTFRRVEERPRMPPRPLRIGEFHFPRWGLSRWGYGFFLVSAEDAFYIRQDSGGGVMPEDGLMQSVEFLFQPDPASIAAPPPWRNLEGFRLRVYALPPICLGRQDMPEGSFGSNVRYSDGLYLQPIVDARYFLRDWGPTRVAFLERANFWDVECGAGFESLLDALAVDLLDPRLRIADLPNSYFLGDGLLARNVTTSCQPLLRVASVPVLLDAMAAAVGSRWQVQPEPELLRTNGVLATLTPLWRVWAESAQKVREYYSTIDHRPARIAGEFGPLENL